MKRAVKKILVIFGTRPEIIKLAPVIHKLQSRRSRFRTLTVTTAQHTDLLYPFAHLFGIRIDHDLKLMEPDQTPNGLCARVLAALDPLLSYERPDFILVQGDTTTTLAGALAGFHHRIPVGHVEAGLRSGNPYSPYPEEMNRRLTTRLASYHFAATPGNRQTLLAEGVEKENIFVTGNPVVDALHTMFKRSTSTPAIERVLSATSGLKRLVLTTHRRESFGPGLTNNLEALRRFVERHGDVALIFPVHPNPRVVEPAMTILSGHPRIYLMPPLTYQDFIALLSKAWLIVSDSGGIQEEAPTLGKPLLILRENTERPEAVESGVARLVGGRPEHLAALLEEVYAEESWLQHVRRVANPFGDGDSGKRIVRAIETVFGRQQTGGARRATH